MRGIFLIMILAGLGLGAAYPWYIHNRSGNDIGTFRVFQRSSGFKPVDVILTPDEAPVRVFVDMMPIMQNYPDGAQSLLHLTATTSGKTVMDANLNFAAGIADARGLQRSEKIFRDTAGQLTDIAAGQYHFVLERGGFEGLSLKTVDLVLKGNVEETDPRAIPAGIGLFAIGLFGLIRSRRSSPPEDSANPKSKWGRDAG